MPIVISNRPSAAILGLAQSSGAAQGRTARKIREVEQFRDDVRFAVSTGINGFLSVWRTKKEQEQKIEVMNIAAGIDEQARARQKIDRLDEAALGIRLREEAETRRVKEQQAEERRRMEEYDSAYEAGGQPAVDELFARDAYRRGASPPRSGVSRPQAVDDFLAAGRYNAAVAASKTAEGVFSADEIERAQEAGAALARWAADPNRTAEELAAISAAWQESGPEDPRQKAEFEAFLAERLGQAAAQRDAILADVGVQFTAATQDAMTRIPPEKLGDAAYMAKFNMEMGKMLRAMLEEQGMTLDQWRAFRERLAQQAMQPPTQPGQSPRQPAAPGPRGPQSPPTPLLGPNQ